LTVWVFVFVQNMARGFGSISKEVESMSKGKLMTGVVVSTLLVIATAAYASWLLWGEYGAPVCTRSGNRANCAVAPDGSGGVLIAWEEAFGWLWDEDRDIYVQRLDSSGNYLWQTDGLEMDILFGIQTDVSVASDGTGGGIVTWVDNQGTDYDIYGQLVDASGDIVWTLGGICLSDSGGGPDHVCVSDSAGGAIVVWVHEGDYSYEQSLRGQRVDASGNLLWSPGGIVIWDRYADFKYITDLEIVPVGSGQYVLVWTAVLDNVRSIFAQKIDSSGNVLWSGFGEGITDGTSYVATPAIVPDGSGGAIVFWEEASGEYGDIYAQRLNPDGIPLWYDTGVPVCTAPGGQNWPVAITDGAGGAIAAWIDGRTCGDFDVYAQRINSSGSPMWTGDGVNLCTATGEQGTYDIPIVPDGAGGAMVFFENMLPYTKADIYGQRVDADGTIQLFPDGMIVRSADGQQREPVAVSDDAGGAIVVWRWQTEAYTDYIYAQRVNPGASASVPIGIPLPGGTLAQNVPNPFSASTRISFSTVVDGDVRLEIFDASGRLVRTLHEGPVVNKSHSEVWDGRDQNGRLLPSGMYFCRANGDGWSDVKKVTLAR
jgi:hypothetical protein